MFSKKRLLESLPAGNETTDLIAEVHGQLVRHMGNEKQFDDIAMMAIHWRGHEGGKD